MMMKRGAGILPYKYENGEYKFMLAHPGGPFWEGVDKWSICKGEYDKGEKCIHAAIREFEEETGSKINGDFFFIGSKKQKSGKLITIFGVMSEIDATKIHSNTFEMEYPKGSGEFHEYPEMDALHWFSYEEAKKKIFKGQLPILEKLMCKLNH